MIEKLRSRHPIDLPAEGWRPSWLLLLVLSGLAGTFVLLPLGLAFALGVVDLTARTIRLGVLASVVVAFGTLVAAWVFTAIRGKPGHARR